MLVPMIHVTLDGIELDDEVSFVCHLLERR